MLMRVNIAGIPLADESFSALVASVTDCAIFLLDPDGNVASWNAGAERIKGYGAEEIIGQPYSVFFTPQDRASDLPDSVRRVARAEGHFQGEGWRVRKDGSRFWAAIVLTALRTPDGELRGYLKVTRDMTEPRRAAERMSASEASLQAFMNFSNAVMFAKDPGGRYVYANEQFLRRFDLRRDQVIGRTDLEIFARAQAERFIANDAVVLARGAPADFEETAIYDRGERVSIVSKFPIHDAQGAIVAIGGIATDISERKKLEQERSETTSQLRELSNRLIKTGESERRRLAQELHDRVGQNLTVLNLNLTFIQNQLTGRADDFANLRARLADSLAVLEETTDCIEDVMNDLHPTMLDSFGLFAALRWHAASFEKRTAIKVALDGDEATPRLPADCEIAMLRIAQEAMVNVVKHARAKRIDVSLRSDAGSIALTVADDGVGFEPASASPPGVLPRRGMWIMHERARSIGALLRVESAPGQGTRILVVLDR